MDNITENVDKGLDLIINNTIETMDTISDPKSGNFECNFNSMKRSIDSDLKRDKRFKTNESFDGFVGKLNVISFDYNLSSSEVQTNIGSKYTHKCLPPMDEKTTNGNNDYQLVPKIESNYISVCDINEDKDSKTPKKDSKQVKWRQNLVNPHYNEDSLLNVLLSETYYFYGTGIVTGEAGDMFGGNRFQGFSRHLMSDSNGITVELCKPFLINNIIIELETKSHKKSPLFSYKVLFAIDECMTEWQVIRHFEETVCFGRQCIQFYPRIVQYIRIVGINGVYCEDNKESEARHEARYFTLFNFDCIFDQNFIE